MRQFEDMYNAANEAGIEAVSKLTVRPMVVRNSRTGESWFIEDGVCGFAWVNVKPGNSKFANWLKKRGLARTDCYYGGVTIWVSAFDQSMQKKEAYARAFAEKLRELGVAKCYAGSRLD